MVNGGITCPALARLEVAAQQVHVLPDETDLVMESLQGRHPTLITEARPATRGLALRGVHFSGAVSGAGQ